MSRFMCLILRAPLDLQHAQLLSSASDAVLCPVIEYKMWNIYPNKKINAFLFFPTKKNEYKITSMTRTSKTTQKHDFPFCDPACNSTAARAPIMTAGGTNEEHVSSFRKDMPLHFMYFTDKNVDLILSNKTEL